MILDILIIAIVLVCSFLGFKKGFAYTFIHTAGWIMALILAFILTDKFKAVIKATPFAHDIFRHTRKECTKDFFDPTFDDETVAF